MSNARNSAPPKFASGRSFRPQVQWAADVDYAKRLKPADRVWLDRFLREFYDTDNKLLRPEKHPEKCATCRGGGDCGRRPPPRALHFSDDLRRECYRRQKAASEDVMSRGLASYWDDFDGVDEAGKTTPTRGAVKRNVPRVDAGDFQDDGVSGASFVPVRVIRAKGKP